MTLVGFPSPPCTPLPSRPPPLPSLPFVTPSSPLHAIHTSSLTSLHLSPRVPPQVTCCTLRHTLLSTHLLSPLLPSHVTFSCLTSLHLLTPPAPHTPSRHSTVPLASLPSLIFSLLLHSLSSLSSHSVPFYPSPTFLFLHPFTSIVFFILPSPYLPFLLLLSLSSLRYLLLPSPSLSLTAVSHLAYFLFPSIPFFSLSSVEGHHFPF